MKTPSTGLHELIQSLSVSERKFFKKFAARHVIAGQSIYNDLFDAIAAQEVYNEASIKQQFSGQAFIEHLSVTKAYLYKLILKSLAENDSSDNDRISLYKELINIEALSLKLQYKQAYKLLEPLKAKLIATERYEFLVVLMAIEPSIAVATRPGFVSYFAQFAIENASYIEKLRIELMYTNIFNILYSAIYLHPDTSKDVALQSVEEVFSNPYFNDITYATTDYLQTLYWRNKQYYYIFLKNRSESAAAFKNIFAIWERNPIWQTELHQDYITTLTIYIQNLRLGKDNDEALKIINTLEIEIQEDKKGNYVYDYGFLYMQELQILQGQNRHELADQLIDSKITSFYEQNKFKISKRDRAMFCFLITKTYIATQQYDKALHWNNQIVNEPKFIEIPDLNIFNKMLNIIIHFEMRNYSYLEYFIINILEHLKKNNLQYPTEYGLVKYLKKIVALKLQYIGTNKSKENAIWQQLVTWLEKQNPVPYFNYLKWVKAQIVH